MEHLVEWELTGKTEVLRENAPAQLCPLHISRELTWVVMGRNQWLTSWAMAWPVTVLGSSVILKVTVLFTQLISILFPWHFIFKSFSFFFLQIRSSYFTAFIIHRKLLLTWSMIVKHFFSKQMKSGSLTHLSYSTKSDTVAMDFSV
jgi:hypothetical protein